MFLDEWARLAEECAARHRVLSRSTRPEQAARLALTELHRLVLDAPANVVNAYRQLDEEMLVREVAARRDRIDGGNYRWQIPAAGGELAWITEIGAQLRALDDSLFVTAPLHWGAVADPDDWRCSETGMFVVPRKHPPSPKNQQPYCRRGLLHHRVLPVEICGYTVRLIWHDTIPPTIKMGEEPIAIGAALFEDFVPTTDDEPIFRVVRADCRDPEATVDSQIESSLADGCFGIVWPELSVPPPLRDRIVKTLRNRALGCDQRPAPQVIVAGTWHETNDGRAANIGRVLDGYGSEKLSFVKAVPFVYEGRPENILPGDDLPILVTDGQLIAFAICKDFCDHTAGLPYGELDIDLVLVPSLGNAETMRGHQDKAKQISARFGTRAFVVQQALMGEPAPPALGYVLPMPKNPRRVDLPGMEQATTWRSYPKP